MSNLLNFPFKKTFEIDLENTVRKFIFCHGSGHPDEFKNDIHQWQGLRKDVTTGTVHVDCIQSLLLWVLVFLVLSLDTDM